MISIDHLTKKFGYHSGPAIDNISIKVLPGRITGIVGPDGAGKTTLVRLIAGLLEPSEGRINVFGFDSVRNSEHIHELLGYMPQRFGLYEDLTVLENLELYAEMRGLEKSQREKRFTELLRFTGLEQFIKRLSGRLSGGMKQKLGLACSLIKMPKLLLLDEPSVGVDPMSRRELWRMVRELVAEDVVVIWNTAYLDEAEACDEVLLLNEGRQLFYGKPTELTRTMEGRVVQIRGLTESKRRKILAKLLQKPETLDGTIQGGTLRLVLKQNTTPQNFAITFLSDNSILSDDSGRFDHSLRAEVIPVTPRFEDGFIDILGGVGKGESVLAKRKPKPIGDGNPIVVAHGLSKRFGSFTAVRDNNFAIKRGEIFGLLGPNGAGKSTTFKMLCGLLKPTEGEGFIAGYDLRKSPSRARSRLGYMAQKFSMYGELTVRQNLNFFAGTYGLWGLSKRRAVTEMLDLFDLGRYSSVNASTLPLGFKQRLSLAAALMHEPDVLFLDEPTSGVDPLTRREFWTHINALVEGGVTVLVTTHFMDEAEYCDRIALIYRGETIASGTPDDLKQSVKTATKKDPTLEDAFIALIESKG
ncbi:MAG: ATP-binding cassette domain-containing protein [Planctomycetaceae bacterium]|jgi:ABC-2 type transport system ATP-binding protein|nr:ATP-binding cassette domain-containing protein [Planctomycetaceae bacterium]